MKNRLLTTWGEELQENPNLVPLPEYPRPSLVRQGWLCLNGEWEYAIRKAADAEAPDGTEAAAEPPFVSGPWDGTIRVPFSPECVLSGVERQLLPGERLWYRRSFSWSGAAAERGATCVLLHFGAADQMAWVWLNGQYVGSHAGGYWPFTLSVGDFLREGSNELTVCVRDDSDAASHARGKQKLRSGGMFYTATSGIWQTVWLEEAPAVHIERIETDSDPEKGLLYLRISCAGEAGDGALALAEQAKERCIHVQLRQPFVNTEDYIRTAEDAVRLRRPVLQEFDVRPGEWTMLRVAEPRLWTQETPWLYGLTARLRTEDSRGKGPGEIEKNGESEKTGKREKIDEVDSYCALRAYRVGQREKGSALLLQNGQPHRQRGVLDQGYWSDGLYTAPSDAAMIYDIAQMKALGFNMLRKHIKIEPERWYYHCDRLGMAVWQDMVCGGGPYRSWFVTYGATLMQQVLLHISDAHPWLFARQDPAGRESFEQDMLETVRLLKSHPCLCTWVLFNEGWGQFDTRRLTERLREADGEYSGRLIDSASGWFDQHCGDFQSIHHYYLRLVYRKRDPRILVLSEFGGLPYGVAGHRTAERTYGYGSVKDEKDLNRQFRAMMQRAEKLLGKGFSAYVYTQVSDVEEEINGILTFDRRVVKIRQGGEHAVSYHC